MTEYNHYWFLAVFVLAGVGFCLGPILVAKAWAHFFSPAKPGPIKSSTYECGLESKGPANIQFKSEYYLYAILFLIFDVETVFLLPFAVAFGELTVGGFLAMMVFLLLLAEGLAWAWAKGILSWR